MDLLRIALERYTVNFPPQSPEKAAVKQAVERSSPSHYRSNATPEPLSPTATRPLMRNDSLIPPSLPVSGKLEIR